MATWQARLRDARQFWDVAEAAHDPAHGNAAASNAILAVIAANDALCLRLARTQPGGESHAEAARVLKEACRGTTWEAEAARRAQQLSGVIRQKAAAQYSGRTLSPFEVAQVMRQAQRFLEWAEQVLATG